MLHTMQYNIECTMYIYLSFVLSYSLRVINEFANGKYFSIFSFLFIICISYLHCGPVNLNVNLSHVNASYGTQIKAK